MFVKKKKKKSAETALEIPTSMVSLNLQEHEIPVSDESVDAH